MRVENLMSREVVTVAPEASLEGGAAVLSRPQDLRRPGLRRGRARLEGIALLA
jgi:hypothetical protein